MIAQTLRPEHHGMMTSIVEYIVRTGYANLLDRTNTEEFKPHA